LRLGTIDTHWSPPWPLAVTPGGDIIVAGAFEGVMDLGTPPLATPPPSWTKPLPYLLRVSGAGKPTLVRSLADIRDGVVRGLALAPGGDAIVGVAAGYRKFVAPQESTVARIDSAGTVVWRRDFANLAGPVQLDDGTVGLVSARHSGTQPSGVHELVILDAATGKRVRSKSLPILAHQTSLTGTSDGGMHMLLYSHNVVPEIALLDHGGLSMSIVSFDHKLDHLMTRHVEFSNGKMLASDVHDRVVVTHMRRFDHGFEPKPHATNVGPAFIEGHGAAYPGTPERELDLSFGPVAVLGDGTRPGQGLELCLDCSVSCKNTGGCVAKGNKCVPTSDAECRASTACKSYGLCSKGRSGCRAPNDQSCATSARCKDEGQCLNRGGYCFGASKPEHCSQSTNCKKRGACALFEDSCAPATAQHCRSSEDCRDRGLCHLVTGYRGSKSCQVKSHADCLRSERCKKYGACSMKADGGRGGVFWCEWRNDADCRRSQGCRERGACSLATANLGDSRIASYCEPHSDADCQRSNACKKDGRCRLVRRQCVK
jgi:hypothetical protein